MTTAVRTSASPVRTAFGGSAEAPIADRTSDSTTMIRTNEVHITKKSGIRDSAVKLSSTSSGIVAPAGVCRQRVDRQVRTPRL